MRAMMRNAVVLSVELICKAPWQPMYIILYHHSWHADRCRKRLSCKA
jgi:hypothetical protein